MRPALVPLLLLAVVVALPFAFRTTPKSGGWNDGDPVIVVVTPHNEAIRYEFELGFSRWHQEKFGRPVKIEWRSIGGTTEIMRYLSSEYASAAKVWWTRTVKKDWPANATETVVASRPPADATLAEVFNTFRATDDPNTLTSRIDVFFGGGQFDHAIAFDQGLTVAPWKSGEVPRGLFEIAQEGSEVRVQGSDVRGSAPAGTQDSALSTQHSSAKPDPRTLNPGPFPIPLIPQRLSGEIWRTPSLFGNVVSTFGICYNADRLKELGATRPPSSWDDLADPIYFRQVGACDPTKSGSIAKAFEMIVHQKMRDTVVAAGFKDADIAAHEGAIAEHAKKIGKAYKPGDLPATVPPEYQAAVERGWLEGLSLIQRIGANARYFTDSAPKVPIDVSAGDAAVGMCIDFYGRYQAQTSSAVPGAADRMVYLTPVGGSSVSCDPISLLRGAGGGADNPAARKERRDIAVRFIEFVLSEEGQKLWTYKPGAPGGPEKFTLRRLPIRRDFYPSTNPVIQRRHEEHRKYAADDLADPAINPYALADKFIYHPRWTGSHFGFHREIIRVMCMDAGDELREAWRAVIDGGGPARNPEAMKRLTGLPTLDLPPRATKENPTPAVESASITWRTAPDLLKRYDRLDFTRVATLKFRENYRAAKELAEARK